jgi:hypothetical protein
MRKSIIYGLLVTTTVVFDPAKGVSRTTTMFKNVTYHVYYNIVYYKVYGLWKLNAQSTKQITTFYFGTFPTTFDMIVTILLGEK